MESKHTPTPGPWHVSKHQNGREALIYGHDDFEVARACYPNRDANACLIAAAPELLEALRALAREASPLMEQWGPRDRRALDAARAAIAKAEGRA